MEQKALLRTTGGLAFQGIQVRNGCHPESSTGPVCAHPAGKTVGQRGASCASQGGVMASSSSIVNVSGAEGAEKTVIHVNITQESSLGSLLKALAAWRQTPKPRPKPHPQGPSAPPKKAGCNAEQKVLGGTQILLGLLTIAIGCVLSLGQGSDYYSYWIFRPLWNGAPFWSGGVLFVAGVLSIVGDRRGGRWVHLATFSHLASVVACSVALAVGEADLPSLKYDSYYSEELCRNTQYRDRYDQPWEPTALIPADNGRVQRCEEMIQNLWKIAAGLRILLLVLCIGALLIAVFCLGNGLRRLCCSFLGRCENYSPLEDPEVPPPYEEPAKEENAA
ncbi:transmembrane protein 176B-like [Podarcis lilfordi]|uniref:Transmembrane protein 176B-like n=2 Tax=Podarcis lilfordi TaxID=74358 RepID=A0AA35PL15_9SAUR|nr:transmembrane protein 176B-like [Podarcis lilfordi]